DLSLTLFEYQKYLARAHLAPSVQLEWSKYITVLGRIDLSKAGFIELINRSISEVPPEIRLDSLRYANITSFLMGNNEETTLYARLTALYRKTLFQPYTPKNYRILGSSWFVAMGHVCSIDFYLKYLKLYAKDDKNKAKE